VDLASSYCSTRRALEEASWNLVTRFSSVSGRLLNLVGKSNRQAFVEAKRECINLRERIDTARLRLEQHRSAHGC
jgi:hypothetical protein